MTYKDAIKGAMDELARDERVVFVGYNVACGSMGGGAFADVPAKQLIETPVAENLMAGMAIGMALDGLKPVLYFERFDFILNAMDAIVNHLDKIASISKGEFQPTVLFRVVVGNTGHPLFTGPTHTQDFTEGLRFMVTFPIARLVGVSITAQEIRKEWLLAYANLQSESTMLVEYKDLYGQQV